MGIDRKPRRPRSVGYSSRRTNDICRDESVGQTIGALAGEMGKDPKGHGASSLQDRLERGY